MNKKKYAIIALGLALNLGISAQAFSQTMTRCESKGTIEQTEIKEGCNKGHFFISNEMLGKLNISQDEIDKARSDGKNMFDVTDSKKISREEVRKIIIEDFRTKLDKMVSEGKISKTFGDEILAKKTAIVEEWDGSLMNHSRN